MAAQRQAAPRAAELTAAEHAAGYGPFIDRAASIEYTLPGAAAALLPQSLRELREACMVRDPRQTRLPAPHLREAWRQRCTAWTEAMTACARAAAQLAEAQRCHAAGDVAASLEALAWLAAELNSGWRALLRMETAGRREANSANRAVGAHSELTQRQRLAVGAQCERLVRRYRGAGDAPRVASGKAAQYGGIWARKRFGVRVTARTLRNWHDEYRAMAAARSDYRELKRELARLRSCGNT